MSHRKRYAVSQHSHHCQVALGLVSHSPHTAKCPLSDMTTVECTRSLTRIYSQ